MLKYLPLFIAFLATPALASFQGPVTFSTNQANTYVAANRRTGNAQPYEATIFINGTFGGGTLALSTSLDKCTTTYPFKDISGNVVTSTAQDALPVTIGGSGTNNNQAVSICGTLTGATSPSITVTVVDNL